MVQLEDEDTDVSVAAPVARNDADAPSTGLRDIARDAVGVPTAVFDELKPVVPGADPRLELTMFWRDARMTVVSLDTPREVTAGIGAVDLPATLPSHLANRFVIARPVGKGIELCFDGSMKVEIRGDDEMPLGLDRLAKLGRVDANATQGKGVHSVVLEARERIAIVIGDVTIAARWVPAPARVAPKPFAWLDRNFATILALTLLIHLVAITVVMLTPPEPSNELPIEMLENPTRVAKLVLEERAKKKPMPRMPSDAAGVKGGKRKGDEGAVGRPSDQKEAAASKPGAPRVDPRKRDRQVALSSGLLQVLGDKPNGATASVFGPGGLGSGINDALGGLRNNRQGEANGVGGSGGRGTSLGGGGKSLGIGGVGNGNGAGKGLANVELGGRGRATEVIPGRTVIKGCMTPEVVGRVVARHNTQVKFCYEKELGRKPDLAGKVVAAFTIGGNGDVLESRVSETTLADSAVEQCLMRVVSHMKFPPCEGGGTAEVTYPWLFKPGGE